MYLVVCYDVVEDRRRARLLKKLKGFLPHVQKSVFEGPLDDRRLEALRRTIAQIIDRQTDTVRIYQLCGRCRQVTEIVGTGVFVSEVVGDEII